MFTMPDAGQLTELAASLNLRLSEGEAQLYLPFILDAMRGLDEFVQSRAEEAVPPLLFPERGPGYRPSLTEDRYQAWLWKCAVGGSDRGPLAGKTVSFRTTSVWRAFRRSSPRRPWRASSPTWTRQW
jgi:amidase